MSPSSLSFDFTPICVQIYDLPMDWRSEVISKRVMSHVGVVLDMYKLSVAGGFMGSLRVQISFEIAKALVST